MKHRIVLIKGVYDTMDLFTDEIEKTLTDMGAEVFVFHAGCIEADLKEFLLFQKKGVTAAITFNSLGYNLELEEGKNLWEYFKIPYMNILMDHPFHYEKSLRHMTETARVYVTDRNHIAYLTRFYPNIKCNGFLPHAGAYYGVREAQNGRPKKIKERKIQILYAGGLPLETASRLVPDLSGIREFDALSMSRTVLDRLIETPSVTTEAAVEEYLKQNGIELAEEKLFSSIEKMRFLDSYATAFFRENAVRVLVESKIPVTVYGSGWENCAWAKEEHFIYGGKVLAGEILPRMADSKIVLSTQTWYKAGAHDRIFNGMLAGAGVVTDTSEYLTEQFTDGRELLFFLLERLRELPFKVKELLEDDDRLQKMADLGQAAAHKDHTWKNRLETIFMDLDEAGK